MNDLHDVKINKGGSVTGVNKDGLNEMGRKRNEKIKKLLDHYDKTTQDVINEIIQEFKSNATTYKQVEKELIKFKREISYGYEGREKYGHLFNIINNVLEDEKNDLPLTNRSELEKSRCTEGSVQVQQKEIDQEIPVQEQHVVPEIKTKIANETVNITMLYESNQA